MLKPFWNKKRRLSMTGDEFEAAISKADTLPVVSAADAGKVLVVDETGAIVPGEGGGDTDAIVASLIEHSYSGVFSTTASLIASSAFTAMPDITAAYFPNCVNLSSGNFRSMPNLSIISMPELTTMSSYGFAQAAIKSIYLPKCTGNFANTFMNCSKLEYANLPKASYLASSCFYSCNKLRTLILGEDCSLLTSRCCADAHALASVYLLYSGVVKPNYNVSTALFDGTPITNSTYTGSFGSIFVPASLYSSYLASASWAVISDRIASIPEDWTP